MYESKIITKEAFGKLRETFRQKGQKVVLCHGVFDLLHYGHLEHILDAKKQGDILVVSVTAAKYVNKGPGRPYFGDMQRLEFLSNLEAVDYVILSEAVTVHEVVDYVQPDVYAKGKEYSNASNDITGNIGSEEEAVRKYGGEIYYTEGEVYSSTKLLNNFFSALPEDVMNLSLSLKKKYGDGLMDEIREDVERFRKLKILVVGDIIFDEYVFCSVQGVTSKDGSLSTFYDGEERYAGGAMAIARHLANFCEEVAFLTMTGTEYGAREFIEKNANGMRLELLADPQFVTPVKRRYLKRHPQRQEYDKLFSVNRLMSTEEKVNFDHKRLHERLMEMLPEFDAVIVGDFGHGLIDEETVRLLCNYGGFVCVNCQTNSANMGTNIITKYERADAFVVDERELRLAFGQALTDRAKLLRKLSGRLHSSYAWVTVGADGAIGEKDGKSISCPAFTLRVKDTVGAGDAFYSVASLCAITGISIDKATLLANAAGAIKTNILGNSESVKKVDMLKFVNTILNV